MRPKIFYLFACHRGAKSRTADRVFYKIEGEEVARTLCGIFEKEYGNGKDGRAFRNAAADSISLHEQVLLDETLRSLEIYDDPDPGVYDPEPDQETMTLAQYGVRAQEWETVLRERTDQPETAPGERSSSGKSGEPLAGAGAEWMPEEDRRNAMLGLLMLLAQAYYRILESAIGMASTVSSLDLELNHSYLWTVKNLRSLLANSPELKDFPEQFKPAVPNLYPSTIQDMEWDWIRPEVEGFLSTVQEYTMDKGMYEPEEKSPAWMMIELFRPGIDEAIKLAAAYHDRMSSAWRKMMARADGASRVAKAGSSAPGATAARDAVGVGLSRGSVITINGKKERIFRISLFPLVITTSSASIEINLKRDTEGSSLSDRIRVFAKRFEAGGVSLTGLKQHPDQKERGIGMDLAACLEGELMFADGHKIRVFCRMRPHSPEEEDFILQEKLHEAGEHEPEVPSAKPMNSSKAASGEFRHRRLRWSADFNDVWVGRKHYDLSTRSKARFCIQFLVEHNSFDAQSARRLDDIDQFVRERSGCPRAADIRIQHYFNSKNGRLPELCRDLIGCARGKGYFLEVE